MQGEWTCRACMNLWRFLVAIFGSIIVIFLIALAIVVLIDHPTGFTEVFDTKKEHFGSLIAGGAAAFSGVVVIWGAVLTIQDHKAQLEVERIQKLKSVNFALAGVFVELDDLCGSMLVGIEKENIEDNQKYHLNDSSIEIIKTVIENMRGSECQSICEVMICYQIMLNMFKKQILEKKYYPNKKVDIIDRQERRKLIIIVISMMSIAQVYVNAAIRDDFNVCLDTFKCQFTENVFNHMKIFRKLNDANEIACELCIKFDQSKKMFDGRIGFLEKDYLKRYDPRWLDWIS